MQKTKCSSYFTYCIEKRLDNTMCSCHQTMKQKLPVPVVHAQPTHVTLH